MIDGGRRWASCKGTMNDAPRIFKSDRVASGALSMLMAVGGLLVPGSEDGIDGR